MRACASACCPGVRALPPSASARRCPAQLVAAFFPVRVAPASVALPARGHLRASLTPSRRFARLQTPASTVCSSVRWSLPTTLLLARASYALELLVSHSFTRAEPSSVLRPRVDCERRPSRFCHQARHISLPESLRASLCVTCSFRNRPSSAYDVPTPPAVSASRGACFWKYRAVSFRASQRHLAAVLLWHDFHVPTLDVIPARTPTASTCGHRATFVVDISRATCTDRSAPLFEDKQHRKCALLDRVAA